VDDTLFCRNGELRDLLDGRLRDAVAEVEKIDANRFLNASEIDLCEALVEEHALTVPALSKDHMRLDYQETSVDLRFRQTRVPIFDPDRPIYRRGTRLAVRVLFTGDAELFHYTPSAWSPAQPEGEVVNSELRLSYEVLDESEETIKSWLHGVIARVEQYLSWVAVDIARYDESLQRGIAAAISERKQHLLKQKGLVAALGIPLRRREDVTGTFALPLRRRAPAIERVAASGAAYAPEPTLADETYEEVLQVIGSMAVAMERSPSTFAHMDEEQIRDLFLVFLNGRYEGAATGEAFNANGKTDILIRHEGCNVFIAECKFWKGATSLMRAVAQLLSYTTWRDTKTALILLNRNADFSAVLQKAPDVLRTHPSLKRELPALGETQFRFVLGRPSDPSREVVVTLIAFDVPRPADTQA